MKLRNTFIGAIFIVPSLGFCP